MGEWWTYGLSDFLMFSPRAYQRLVAGWNEWMAPAGRLAGMAGPLVLLLALDRRGLPRAGAALLGLAWAWVGWAFLWQRYATLFLGARPLAVAFWLQAGLLFRIALGPQPGAPASSGAVAAGWALVVGGLLAWPLGTAWTGDGLASAEMFGWMPEPTALATLGFVLAGALPAGPALRRALLVIPALVVAAGLLTRWALAQYATA